MAGTLTAIVPVIGLPGCGKSTLCLRLQEQAAKVFPAGNVQVQILAFDDLFKEYEKYDGGFDRYKHETQQREAKDSTPTNYSDETMSVSDDFILRWSERRRRAIASLTSMVSENNMHEAIGPSDSKLFGDHVDRTRKLELCIPGKQKAHSFSSIPTDGYKAKISVPESAAECKTRLLLVDDNFYYRSMRKEVNYIADVMGLGYVQLWVHCELKEAIRRDAEREGRERVGSSVITRMHSRFDIPDPKRWAWDRYTILVNTGTTDTIDMSTDDVLPIANSMETVDMKGLGCSESVLTVFNKLLQRISEACSQPSRHTMAMLKFNQRRESQEQNMRSLLHQLDLQLKLITGKRIGEFREAQGNVNIKELAAALTNIRRSLMITARMELEQTRGSLQGKAVQDATSIGKDDPHLGSSMFIKQWCQVFNDKCKLL
eukprot:CFRG8097T1